MHPDKNRLEELLALFQSLVRSQSGDERIQLDYEWAWRFRGGESEFHLGASVMIHGNEVGPLEGLLDIMEALSHGRLHFPGTFTCFIGNPEAGRLGQRFVDVDLNRVFDAKHLDQAEVSSHEVRRVQKLIPLLDEFDLYIDFHQTVLDSTQPFYISQWQIEDWRWMRLMGGAQVWVTRDPKRAGGGLKCADEYVRQRGKPSVALELGALGFSAKARSGVWRSLSRVANAISELHQGEADLASLAMSQPDLQFYETHTRYLFDDPALKLAPGWVNFAPVEQGQLLTSPPSNLQSSPPHAQDVDGSSSTSSMSQSSSSETAETLEAQDNGVAPEPWARHAATSGALLFPKYPPRDERGLALDPRPKELCRIIRRLDGHPLDLWEED